VESFADNQIMLAVVKWLETNGVELRKSEKDLPVAVLKSNHGSWFVGYVNAHLDNAGSKAEKGTSKYSKGYFAYQSAAIREAHEITNTDHLKLSSDTPGTILAKMDSFTKEYWGLRGSISNLFKHFGTKKYRGEYASFLKSAEELKKNKLRKSMPFENGGIFTVHEQAFIKVHLQAQIQSADDGAARIQQRDERLAKDFHTQMSDYTRAMRQIDDYVKPLIALRAPVLFPTSKKKADITWSKKPLSEKLPLLDEKHLVKFSPHQFTSAVKSLLELPPIAENQHYELARIYQAPGYDLLHETLQVICQEWVDLLSERT